jgi:hypothetical protein
MLFLLSKSVLCLKYFLGCAYSSESDVDHKAIIIKLLDSIFNIWWKPNSHATDLIEKSGFVLHKVAYSTCRILKDILEEI